MATQETEATSEAKVREIMDELGVSRDAARLLLTIESGYALVDDRVSLTADQSLEEYLDAMLRQAPFPPGRTA